MHRIRENHTELLNKIDSNYTHFRAWNHCIIVILYGSARNPFGWMEKKNGYQNDYDSKGINHSEQIMSDCMSAERPMLSNDRSSFC